MSSFRRPRLFSCSRGPGFAWHAAFALSVAALLALGGGPALAQQQPPSQAPGQAPAAPFPGHPPLGPGSRPFPRILGPDGRLQGQPPGHGTTRPMPLPGRPGHPPTRPPRQHAPAAAEEEHAGGGEHECPGHGPDDAPPPVNYWHGLLMVDNDRAVKPDFLDRLLFRYENPKDPCDPKNEPAPYLASLINFAILVYILYRFARKPIAESLLKRKNAIMADIDTATKLKEDAQARLDEYEEKLEHIGAKLDEVRAEYAALAELEKKHILAEAEERRVRMRRDAEFRLEQERKTVREELLHEAVTAATAAAEALIQKQMSAADHARMADDFLASVGAAIKSGPSPANTAAALGGAR